MPKISSVKIQDDSEDQKSEKKTHTVEVELVECSKNIRLHAFATQFVPNESFSLGKNLADTLV